MSDLLTYLPYPHWLDNALFVALIIYMILGALRGFGRTFVHALIFFASSIFALWWFTPYLTTFTPSTMPALLINLVYFWVGNTAIAWLATKVVMALDSNGAGPISRIGGLLMGAVHAVSMLIVATVAYAIAQPEEDRLSSLPNMLSQSQILQKSNTTASNIYTFLENSGALTSLTSRELSEEEANSEDN